jgi:hypothetical protein
LQERKISMKYRRFSDAPSAAGGADPLLVDADQLANAAARAAALAITARDPVVLDEGQIDLVGGGIAAGAALTGSTLISGTTVPWGLWQPPTSIFSSAPTPGGTKSV